MKKKITLELINSFDPCYDPEEIGFTSKLSLTPIECINQFKDKIESKDNIIWLLCREEFMSTVDLRLFAVWCVREALKLIDNPDERSINICNVSERFANGEATDKELNTARNTAWDAVGDAPRDILTTVIAAWDTGNTDASKAAKYAAWNSTKDVVKDVQIEKLKEYLK